MMYIHVCYYIMLGWGCKGDAQDVNKNGSLTYAEGIWNVGYVVTLGFGEGKMYTCV